MTTQSADTIPIPVAVAVQPTDVIPPEVRETAARLGVDQYLQQVIELTREIYGGFSRVTVLENPELPDDTHIVFHVPVYGSIDAALDRSETWGRRLRDVIPRCPRVYVPSMDFQA